MSVQAYLTGLALIGLVLVVGQSRRIPRRKPTHVYFLFGDVWRKPRRLGINITKDWDFECWRRCVNPSCRSRLCRYKHGQDTGAQSWLWSDQVDWPCEPAPFRWFFQTGRRNRVFYWRFPFRFMAKAAESFMLRWYRPPYNQQECGSRETVLRRAYKATPAHLRHLAKRP